MSSFQLEEKAEVKVKVEQLTQNLNLKLKNNRHRKQIVMYTSFSQMPVWKSAFDLSIEVFSMTANLPKSEDYGLTSQVRRSANSVGANISEGFGRVTGNDKAYFYAVSRGSAYETKHHLRYGCAVGYFDKDEVANLIKQYQELINSLNKII